MKFFVTTDVMLLAKLMNDWHVLLIQRKNEPYKDSWALPGGFVEEEEDLEDAAKRELFEETGIKVQQPLIEIGAFGKPHRDPRGRVVTIVYAAILNEALETKASSDAKNVHWFSSHALPLLAFDHLDIVHKTLSKVVSGE